MEQTVLPSVNGFVSTFRKEFFVGRDLLEAKFGQMVNLNMENKDNRAFIEITGYNEREYLARRTLAEFSISLMPKCSAVAISHDVMIRNEFRGRGIGRFLHAMKLRALDGSGFKVVMCTVREDNAPELKILKSFGWHHADTFNNGHGKIQLWTKVI